MERPLKIAQVAPLYESVPPKLYGGTERIVSYLTEALVDLGHDVTLFASGDSSTRAKLRPACRRALRLDESSIDANADHVLLAEKVFQSSSEFDIVHSHIDYVPFPLLRRMSTPHVTTLHGRLDVPNLQNLYREFSDEPVVSISNRQRLPLPWANWQATVYHGVPATPYTLHEKPGAYLAFLGRISPEKRVEDAIEVAARAGLPIKIAAKVDKVDSDYFKEVIKPLLRPGVEYIGEIGEHEKSDFLGNALALLFMIDWPEPFGLAMIESLACGTPVIARNRGSVPEVIEHGTSGILVENIGEAQKAVEEVQRLSRKKCREIFEKQFSSVHMARNYEAVYLKLIRKAGEKPADSLAAAA